jgi:PAS domain S-box-containing protein/diguanylate cyclase (GGDEF)-like protein
MVGNHENTLKELLDMYESASEMYAGAIMRIDLSNGKILYSENLKQITGIGKNELPNNLDELLALIKEEDAQKLIDKFYNIEYEAEWSLKISSKSNKEGFNKFDLTGKKKRRDEKDVLYILVRNPNQNFGLMSPDTFFPKEMFDTSPQAIVITDKNNKVVRVNKAFLEMTGYTSDEVIGKGPNFWASNMHDKNFYEQMWQELKSKGFWSGRIIDRKKNGEMIFLYSNFFEIKGYNNKVIGYMAINTDITNNVKKEEEITRVIKHDSLTGLPNMKGLLERIEDVRQKKPEEKKFAILIVKIDELHELIDLYGLETMNHVIKDVAKKIIEIVDKKYFVSVISKHEFALLGSFEDVDELEKFAANLLNNLSKPFQIFGERIFLKMKIGVSNYPVDSTDPEDLINQSKIALKGSEKKTINFYSPELSKIFGFEKKVEDEINLALENKGLLMYFQPQIDTNSMNIIGAEALIRLQKENGSILSPNEFLGIAKKNALMDKIDQFVLEEAIKSARVINASLDKNIRIFFNVSKSFFEREDFLYNIESMLHKYNLNPSYLGIELTEDLFIEDFYSAQKKIKALKEIGLKIALDDFGTGFSSLSYLNKLDIDKIKIDKSFIDNILHDKTSQRLVSSIISMSKSLGFEVIAEGVESEGQLLFLQEEGCYEVQGYYFSKPLSFDQFRLFLKRETIKI